MDKLTAVVRIPEEYWDKEEAAISSLAAAIKEIIGEGGRPEETNPNNKLGFVNTRVFNHYFRVLVDYSFGTVLENMQATSPLPFAELIRVEWQGQDMVDSGDVDEEGSPIYVEQLIQTGTRDVTDDEGTVIDTLPVYLGRIG